MQEQDSQIAESRDIVEGDQSVEAGRLAPRRIVPYRDQLRRWIIAYVIQHHRAGLRTSKLDFRAYKDHRAGLHMIVCKKKSALKEG